MVARAIILAPQVPQTIDASEGALTAANYLRVSSIAIATYEYVVRIVSLIVIVT